MKVKPVRFISLNDIPRSAWEVLSTKKIYFGHQSVGFNIIDGIRDVMKENPFIKLTIKETNDPKDFEKPIFAHSRIGQNTNPNSKCDAFSECMQKGIGKNVDIAFFKFCFVDITKRSDPDKVFGYYKNILSNLQSKYTEVQFIHVTIPLVTTQKGIKAWIKKFIDRPIKGYQDNIARNQFNNFLRDEYTTTQPIYDLSLVESTYPNGYRSFFSKDNKIYFDLVPEYSDDGGHLNIIGRKLIAEQLLILLANLTNIGLNPHN